MFLKTTVYILILTSMNSATIKIKQLFKKIISMAINRFCYYQKLLCVIAHDTIFMPEVTKLSYEVMKTSILLNN